MIDSSQDKTFKHSLTLVEGSKSQFQLRRLRAAGLTGKLIARRPLLKCQNKKKRLVWTIHHHQYTTKTGKRSNGPINQNVIILGLSHRVFVHYLIGERLEDEA